MRSAEEWWRLVRGERRGGRVVVVRGEGVDGGVGEGEGEGRDVVVRFMVDLAGGRTRVVLGRMRGVFEVLLGRGGVNAGGRGSGSKVRFAPAPVVVRERNGAVMEAAGSVGMWEDWRGGRLEGSRLV